MSASVQRADLPPVIQPMRGMPLMMVLLCPWLGFILTSSGFWDRGWPVTDLVVVAHSDRVVGVEAPCPFYKDAGNAVDGSGDDVFIVKADVLGVRFDGVVEVCTAFRAQAEVPLAHCCSGVAFFLEHQP